MKAVFDTNILIDYLNGLPQAREEIARYEDRFISRITWMEVLTGVLDTRHESSVRGFLSSFTVTELATPVAEEAVRLRRERKLRFPDAVILAAARTQNALLITRNTKDFNPAWPEIREPYRL